MATDPEEGIPSETLVTTTEMEALYGRKGPAAQEAAILSKIERGNRLRHQFKLVSLNADHDSVRGEEKKINPQEVKEVTRIGGHTVIKMRDGEEHSICDKEKIIYDRF